MTDEAFTNKIEKKLHVGIVAWNFIMCIFLLVTKNFNPVRSGTTCFINAFPPGCIAHPEMFGECTRGRNALVYLLLHFGVISLIIIGIIVIMGMLCSHVISRERNFRKNTANADTDTVVSQRQQEAESLMNIYRREMTLQAGLYGAVFLMKFSLLFSRGVLAIAGKMNMASRLHAAMSFWVPLGGFLNILIHTRPSVVTLHRRYSEYSWLSALWLVLKAGGEVPDESDPSAFSMCCCYKNKEAATGVASQSRLGRVDVIIENGDSDEDSSVLVLSGDLRVLISSKSLGPKSIECENGQSMSFGDENIAYRSEKDWSNVGRESPMMSIFEHDENYIEKGEATTRRSELSIVSPRHDGKISLYPSNSNVHFARAFERAKNMKRPK